MNFSIADLLALRAKGKEAAWRELDELAATLPVEMLPAIEAAKAFLLPFFESPTVGVDLFEDLVAVFNALKAGHGPLSEGRHPGTGA